MAHDVFISFSQQDKSVADAACAKLEAEGVRCWIAPRDVPPGLEWAPSIIDAIDECRAMVLIFSAHANGSRQVRREVQQAFDKEKPVIPFRIEDVVPNKALSYYVSTIHWLDALTPPLEQHLEELSTSVRALLGLPLAKQDVGTPLIQRTKPRRSRFSLFGVISSLLLVVALSAIALWVGMPVMFYLTPKKTEIVTPSPSELSLPKTPAPATLSATISALSRAQEQALRPLDAFRECGNCPEMIAVPTGSFIMGSPVNETARGKDEGPQHTVAFATPFAVGKFAITFDEWDVCAAEFACQGEHSDNGWGRGSRPAIMISWIEAKQYVEWLSRKTGRPYRLLSESEHEYVTRAGTTSPFWFGNTISLDKANYGGVDSYSRSNSGFRKKTVPVDTFRPNPWGLYQVHGNVREWTEDCYNDNYGTAPNDGSAWVNGNCTHRVLRNGSWVNLAALLRSAFRGNIGDINLHSDTIGFRVARTLNLH